MEEFLKYFFKQYLYRPGKEHPPPPPATPVPLVEHKNTLYIYIVLNQERIPLLTECYARSYWSLPMIYYSTDMDDVTGKLFSLFLSNMARGFENVCEIISN